MSTIERIPIYCALCVSRCGAIAAWKRAIHRARAGSPASDGRSDLLEGRAAPEFVYSETFLAHELSAAPQVRGTSHEPARASGPGRALSADGSHRTASIWRTSGSRLPLPGAPRRLISVVRPRTALLTRMMRRRRAAACSCVPPTEESRACETIDAWHGPCVSPMRPWILIRCLREGDPS